VEDQASVVSRGVIEIASKGRGTETFLSDHVLLLDPKAQARAVPKLKIETNDVKASHSASVSRIHPEDLFYMMSRGISKEEAREMYVEGFLAELLEGISGSGLRGRLRGNL
jgi:Fe-S cluster assembly scaffold protein SufB